MIIIEIKLHQLIDMNCWLHRPHGNQNFIKILKYPNTKLKKNLKKNWKIKSLLNQIFEKLYDYIIEKYNYKKENYSWKADRINRKDLKKSISLGLKIDEDKKWLQKERKKKGWQELVIVWA